MNSNRDPMKNNRDPMKNNTVPMKIQGSTKNKGLQKCRQLQTLGFHFKTTPEGTAESTTETNAETAVTAVTA